MIYDVFDTVSLTYKARDLRSYEAACKCMVPGCEIWELQDNYTPVASYSFSDGQPVVRYCDSKANPAVAEM